MVKKSHPSVDSSDFDGRICPLEMIWYALLQVIVLVFDVLHLSTRSKYDKDLEILILRRQLTILQRLYGQKTSAVLK